MTCHDRRAVLDLYAELTVRDGLVVDILQLTGEEYAGARSTPGL